MTTAWTGTHRRRRPWWMRPLLRDVGLGAGVLGAFVIAVSLLEVWAG